MREGDQLDGLLRRALRDPSLQVAYWRDETGEYVDATGRPFSLPPPDERPGGHGRRAGGATDRRAGARRVADRGPGARVRGGRRRGAGPGERTAARRGARPARGAAGLASPAGGGRGPGAPPARAQPARRGAAAAAGRLDAAGPARTCARTRRHGAGRSPGRRGPSWVGRCRSCASWRRVCTRPCSPTTGWRSPWRAWLPGRRSPWSSSWTCRAGRRRSVEVAAYYVICEALANAVKHAAADRGDRARARRGTGTARPLRRGGRRRGRRRRAGQVREGRAWRVCVTGSPRWSGRLEVISPLGEGTTVTAVIPCG